MTGHYRYTVDQAMATMIARCRELDLRMLRSEEQTRIGAAVLLTIATLSYLRGKKPLFRR